MKPCFLMGDPGRNSGKMEECTLMLQKSRVLQIRGVKGEAVVLYCEPLTTKEMRYPRLSHRVNNMAAFHGFKNATWS